jgi:hypothetical protein
MQNTALPRCQNSRVTCLLAAAAVLVNAGPRDPALDARVQSMLPSTSEELWLQIPWQSDIQVARLEAQQSDKPLFLWMMNGHPLGCT